MGLGLRRCAGRIVDSDLLLAQLPVASLGALTGWRFSCVLSDT